MWALLLQELAGMSPSKERDVVSWALEPSRAFLVSSLYQKK
jgi:hypothetical protein